MFVCNNMISGMGEIYETAYNSVIWDILILILNILYIEHYVILHT